MASRRTYSRSFKLQALELARSGQKSISQIERDLGITPGLLHKWKARMKADGQQAFPGKGHLKEDEELIQQLKRENEVLVVRAGTGDNSGWTESRGIRRISRQQSRL